MPPLIGNMLQIPSRRSSNSNHCSHPKITPITERLDAQSDMILIVGREKCTDVSCSDERQNGQSNAILFRVNSTVIAGCSPAFGLVLYSPSGEVPKEDGVKWTVRLPDDDPKAMEIILHILYGYYPRIPSDEHMNLAQLLNLTVLAHKYDFVHLFRKWSPQWVKDMEQYWVGKEFVGKSTEDLESLLWIFWVLGHQPLYIYTVLQLAFYSQLDVDGKLIDPAGQLCFTNEFRDVPVPPYAAVEIAHARIGVLKIIHKEIKATLEDHLHGRDREPWLYCRRIDGEDDWGWRQSVFESFVKMLEAEGIWPLPSAYTLTASPKGLAEMFRVNPNIPSFIHHYDGRFCDAHGTFWERMGRLFREVRFGLPVASARHFHEQSSQSGLGVYFKATARGSIHPHNKSDWNVIEIMEFQDAIAACESARAQAHLSLFGPFGT